ncbi:transcriptional regulator, LacI family [Amphibacillus marinus]|uniref:Transcriptional regulator, LacI family n=1 Tax=Amphibacillus marinus TaxID=872970 RepID=A0A1H8HAA2_9BACI|nr:LacI family DNA-binding transcriptional regulator [Amphibacillus marinus]SEN53020.1 transcriptional regulator, LacI family [Amphibacillus marinus]
MSVTIKDIAIKAGVSYSTVSKALNNSPLVKQGTKDKITRIANELGYQPNYAAQRLVNKKTNMIGLIWPTIERSVPAQLVMLIREALEQKGFSMILSVDPIETALEMFKRFQIDGLIIFEGSDRYDLSQINIPLVAYGINRPHKHYPLVDANHRAAIGKAIDHFVRLGHRHIQFVGQLDSKDPFQLEKQNGFTQALAEHNFKYTQNNVIGTTGLDWFDGYQAIQKCIESHRLGSALISASYELSQGIVRYLAEHSIQVPDQVSIISYDNIMQMSHIEIPLSAVGVTLPELTHVIVSKLLQQFGEQPLQTMLTKLTPELVIRQSSLKSVQ